MAKKKKSQRKRNFAYSSTGPAATAPVAKTSNHDSKEAPQTPVKAVKMASGLDLRFVSSDIRRVTVISIFCISLELVLWFLLRHTSLGNFIYG